MLGYISFFIHNLDIRNAKYVYSVRIYLLVKLLHTSNCNVHDVMSNTGFIDFDVGRHVNVYQLDVIILT